MRTVLLYVLFFLSGTTALVYELVWVRELVFVFGGTTYAITTVLVAFMAGLGLGSYLAGRWSYRLAQPGRVFGYLEIGIGAYALAVPGLLSVAEPVYRALYPVAVDAPLLLNVVRFIVGCMVVLVPATMMGATLPVLVRHVTVTGHALGRSVGYLYGVNTFGAVLGVVLAGFVLLPALGLEATTRLAATVDIVVGIVAVNLFLQRITTGAREPRAKVEKAGAGAAAPALSDHRRHALLAGYAASGFAAMVYQITWNRSLVMSVGSSTYSFTCILAAFILGLALGSLAIAPWADRWKNPMLGFGVLELLIGLVAVVIMPLHGLVPLWIRLLVVDYSDSFSMLLGWQFLLVIAITSVPTFLMGAIFPLVTRAIAAGGVEPANATGRAYAANTIGTITGAFLAGFVLIRSDVLGVQNSIILASILNGVVGAWLVVLARPGSGAVLLRRAVAPGLLLVLIPVVALCAGRWDPNLLTSHPFLNRGELPPRQIKYYAEGVDVTVGIEHPLGHPELLTLTVNGKPDASTTPKDMLDFNLLGHLPALLDRRGESVCVIGLGSGLSLGALACYPSYTRLDCVEISDDVIEGARYFDVFTYNVRTADQRVNMIRADGRNHLLLTDQKYDLIISQPPNPWMAGVANLFTREYFMLARRCLTEGGLFAAWLQGYGTSVQDFRMVVRTLFDVFGHVSLWELGENDYLLVASVEPHKIDLLRYVGRFGNPRVRADLYRMAIRRPGELLGRFITADEPLREWAATAPLHTDDNALLEFSAPRYLYAGQIDELLRELSQLQRPVLDEFLTATSAPPPPPLRAIVQGVVGARWGRLAANDAARRGDVAGALRILIDNLINNPSNILLYIFLGDQVRELREQAPELAARPDIANLVARFERLVPPRCAPVTGGTPREIADHFRAAARQAYEDGDAIKAVDFLDGARDLDPGNVEDLDALAGILTQLPSEPALETLLADVAAGYGAAARRAGAVGDWDLAVKLLTRARELAPTERAFVHGLAELLIQAGRMDDAKSLLEEHVGAHGADGNACYLLAVLAVEAGQQDAALEWLAKALRYGPATAADAAADERFSALRGNAQFQMLIAGASAGQPGPATQP